MPGAKRALGFDNEDALVGFWPDEVVLEHAKRDWLTAQKYLRRPVIPN